MPFRVDGAEKYVGPDINSFRYVPIHDLSIMYSHSKIKMLPARRRSRKGMGEAGL